MTQRSNVTFERFPTIQEVVKELLEGYMDNNGYGDFYDMAKVLYSTKHEDIVKELISQAEDMNDEAMKANGLCPECGSHLTYRPNLEMFYCVNNACGLGYGREAV